MEAELKHRLRGGLEIMGGLVKLWRNRGNTVFVKMGMLESIVVPAVLCGSECRGC